MKEKLVSTEITESRSNKTQNDGNTAENSLSISTVSSESVVTEAATGSVQSPVRYTKTVHV